MSESNSPHSTGAFRSPQFLPATVLLFVGSGCAALIYEVVWLHMLQLVIGLTTVSLGILLGTYMGGMCLGSLLLARVISSKHHPLRVYAFLEVGIGLIGIAVLFLMPLVNQLYTSGGGSGFGSMLLRGGLAAVCLLPPTLLMGATLPAISRWVEATPRGVSWLGFFYGGNIVGAVAGCLFAGFYLLRVHDVAFATYVAAALNIVVALCGLMLAKMTEYRPVSREKTEDTPGSGGTTIVYVTTALSGLAALGAEVVWTRLLSLTLGGTVYTFSIILAVFLAGLGIGSSAGASMARSIRRPRFALGCCQLLLVAAVGWTAYAISDSLPYWPVDPALAKSPWYTFQLDIVRCLWAILPAACLWGASFPLALASVGRPGQDPGLLVGRVYAANTVGAILGSLAFSMLLVPRIGTRVSEQILIGISGAAALLMFVSLARQGSTSETQNDVEPGSRSASGFAALVSVGLAVLLITGVTGAPWGVYAYGRFMATYGNRLATGIVPEANVPTSGSPDIYCTYVGEGLNGSIAVTKWTSGTRNFHSAGKVQASNEPLDMRLQRMLGHISALAHPNPESVLVVACGAGVTAGSFVVHPSVKRIVICDIEPLVPQRVAPMFAAENYSVVSDPRTQVMLDDGRHFIRTTREKFDVITSDPIDPWVKGCAALNTVEYYQMCKEHLKPGGVMSLWIPLYESNSETFKSVLATFFKVFPDGIVWSNDNQGEGYDAVLFGQAGPSRFDLDALQARLDRPDHARVKQSLTEVGFGSAVSLLSTFAVQAPDLLPWMQNAQINNDRDLRLQYLAGLSLNSYIGGKVLNEIKQYYQFPEKVFVGSETSREMLRTAIGGFKAQP